MTFAKWRLFRPAGLNVIKKDEMDAWNWKKYLWSPQMKRMYDNLNQSEHLMQN